MNKILVLAAKRAITINNKLQKYEKEEAKIPEVLHRTARRCITRAK